MMRRGRFKVTSIKAVKNEITYDVFHLFLNFLLIANVKEHNNNNPIMAMLSLTELFEEYWHPPPPPPPPPAEFELLLELSFAVLVVSSIANIFTE